MDEGREREREGPGVGGHGDWLSANTIFAYSGVQWERPKKVNRLGPFDLIRGRSISRAEQSSSSPEQRPSPLSEFNTCITLFIES